MSSLTSFAIAALALTPVASALALLLAEGRRPVTIKPSPAIPVNHRRRPT